MFYLCKMLNTEEAFTSCNVLVLDLEAKFNEVTTARYMEESNTLELDSILFYNVKPNDKIIVH